ncbi:MAG: peptidoglycan editing factor PgeF [Candidatus Moraniibacteriota bacterium]
MKKVQKGFSEKGDGSMYLTVTDALPENIANRKRFFEAKGLGGRKIIVANLVHGTNVEKVDAASDYFILRTDALVTKSPEIILTLTGADCFPVYFEEKTAGIIGLAHCGWKGIVGGIVEKTIATMVGMGGKAAKIAVTIGPGICAEYFEIQDDALPAFAAYDDFIIRDKNIRADLKGIIRKQTADAGIALDHISDWNECTYCLSEKYFSYRREKPEYIEAQVAYIVQFPHRKF